MNVKKSRRRSLRILKSTTTPCEDGADCGVTGAGAEVFGSAWLADTVPQQRQQECTPLDVRPQPETDDSARQNGHLQPETDSCVHQNNRLHSGTVNCAPQNVCVPTETGDCAPQNVHLQSGTDDSTPLCDCLTFEGHGYTSGKIHLQPETLEQTPQKGHLEVETHEHTPLKSHLTDETQEHTPLRSHLKVDTHEHNPQNVQLLVETLEHTPLNVHLQAETVDSDPSCGRCRGDEAASEDTSMGDRSTGDWQTLGHLQQCETIGDSVGPVPSEGIAGEHSDRVKADELREAFNIGFLCGDLSPRFDISSPALGENHSFQDFSSLSERSRQDESMTAVPCSVVVPDSRDGYLVSNGDLNVCASPAGLNTEQSNTSSTGIAQSENSAEMSNSEMPVMEKSGEAAKACQGAAESTTDGDADTSRILAPEEHQTGVIPASSLTSTTASVPERQERLAPGRDELEPSFCALKSEISLSKTPVSDLDENDASLRALKLDISMSERLTPGLNKHDASLLARESDELDGSLHAIKSEIAPSKRQVSELNEHDTSLHTLKTEMSTSKRQVSELNEHDTSLHTLKKEMSTSKRQVSELNEHDPSLHTLKTEMSTSKRQVSELNEHDTSLHTLKSETAVLSPVPCRDGEAETCTVNKLAPSVSEHVGDMTANDSFKTVTALHDINMSTECHPTKSPERDEMNGLFSLPLFTEQKPSWVESRGSKAERKSKKQRRRSAFGADLHLQSFAEEEVASNLESSRAEVALDQAVDSDLAVTQREETQLASNLTSAAAKKKKKRRSADVCVMAPDCQDATESTCAETCVENKCSTSKRRRSSLRLYRQQSHKQTELNTGDDAENKTGENSESHGLPGAADERNNTQQASQADGVADVMADDLSEDDGTVSSELKQLYCNKNYKEPAGKTWETIFEVPSKGKLVSKKKQKRYVLFEDRIPLSKLKQRSKKAAQNGWNLGSLVLTKTDQDVEEKLKQLDKEVLDIH